MTQPLKTRRSSVLSKLILGAALPIVIAAPLTAARAEMTSTDLVKALRAGGYTVYMRHTKTQKGQEDVDHKNLANCATQRNLSEAGREQARVIGKIWKDLNIKFSDVQSSPYCRAKETAKIALGDTKLLGALRYMSHIPDAERPAAIETIKAKLGAAPPKGTNTILISHTENLKRTTNIWPKVSGVAHIFKPMGNGKFAHLGKIDPDEWAGLAKAFTPSKTCIWKLCW